MNIFRRYYNNRIRRLIVEKKLIFGICSDIKRYWLAIWHSIDRAVARNAWKKLSKKTPIVKNQVMFRTFQEKYTCNPKYVCEELIKSGEDFKIVWAYSVKKSGDLSQFPPQVELVKFGSLEYYTAMAQSHYWIDNAHNFTWEAFPKKDEQILINLWHGSMGLKRIDAENDTNKKRIKAGHLATKTTNYCVTNSKFEEDVFRSTYWPNTEFLKYGHARNDVMFSSADEFRKMREYVCEQTGLNPDDKFLLYAPTFRDNSASFEYFDINYPALKAALEKRFGGNWVILQRFHFHTQQVIKKQKATVGQSSYDFVVSVSDYDDMQELMMLADIGITDYSSWICDFVLTKRPGFLFATDVDSYVEGRGFYYKLEDTPFPVCRSNDELINAVKNFDNDKYLDDVDAYCKMLGCYEEGNASKRIVNKLKELLASD